MDTEALARKLDKQIGWRKKEIITLRTNANIADGSSQATMLRCLAVISYAHWEGFVKESAGLYFDFIMSQNLCYSQLSESFIATAISARARETIPKPSYYHEVAQFTLYQQQDRAAINAPKILSEMGMLNSQRLSSILYCLAIKNDTFELKFNWLDKVFIERRNKVAHGEYTKICDVEISEYLQLADDVIDYIETFRNSLLDSATEKSYRRQPFHVLSCERL